MYTRTVTPDQINTEALLQSRDYFNTASDFGATFSSEHGAAAQRARNVRSTLSPLDTGDSIQYNTDTIEPDSIGGWPAGVTSGEFGETVESTDGAAYQNPRSTYELPAARSKVSITIPTITSYNDDVSASDDEDVSERSNQ